ncbi:MAG: acetyl/propionyl/methylcrotonyl-CoA carboxylase subunit alpha [Rickettsiaceae bacterium]|nr:acetyl/propionyl/methylcrotonyl-CoA carboxylase subunit alpha [Rickettsiaceae bacterium]
MKKPLFDKILVANRGEIALRIMKTLRKMGIKSAAIYSEADTNSPHVQYADEAYYIGNSPATSSYLSIKNIINAVRLSGAQAVHPGYGFLSENPNFANILKREGVILIGPSAKVIKQMGDKIEAKKIAIDSGVSTVPGYIGSINSLEQALEITKRIGYPIIIKAAAGGGGRGMRVVSNAEEMQRAYESAKLEAENCFSDSRVFIEKLVQAPRHIEIQLLADQYGNIVCLGERECSIQRYHQKVIEEAPSSFVDEETRQKIYQECKNLAQKVGYYSAGTVEFMMEENKNYYFLEMNTRLQVEHPVTEMITGYDIVEHMIKIAAGEKLEFTQEDVKLKGWAFEARICSEDPTRGFLPSSGRILEYQEPPKNNHIRVDSGVISGGEVSMYYDAMIAKLCTYGETRQQALELLKTSLSSFIIQGISHNISFLEALVNHPRFARGDINTNFIDEEYPNGFSGATITSEINKIFLATTLFVFLTEQKRISRMPHQLNNQYSKIGTRWIVSIDGKQFPVIIKSVEDGYEIRQEFNRISIRGNWSIGNMLVSTTVNNKKVNVKLERIKTKYRLNYAGVTVECSVRSPRLAELESLMLNRVDIEENNELKAPLSGQIIKIAVSEGDQVVKDQELLILTAMKMENIITAPRSGKIAKILVSENDNVYTGQILINFE